MTMTISPLMGHLSTTYAIRAGPDAAFCSRFDFNIYSYESDLVIGCELWRRRPYAAAQQTFVPMSSTPPMKGDSGGEEASTTNAEEAPHSHVGEGALTGVLKARWAQSTGLSVLWEGRVKHLWAQILILEGERGYLKVLESRCNIPCETVYRFDLIFSVSL